MTAAAQLVPFVKYFLVKGYFMVQGQFANGGFNRNQVVVSGGPQVTYMQFGYGHYYTFVFHILVGISEVADGFGPAHFKILGIIAVIYNAHLVCFGITYPYLCGGGKHCGKNISLTQMAHPGITKGFVFWNPLFGNHSIHAVFARTGKQQGKETAKIQKRRFAAVLPGK
jgi:hypothetical protein